VAENDRIFQQERALNRSSRSGVAGSILYHRDAQVRRMLPGVPYAMNLSAEVIRSRFENVWNEALRIAIIERKPRALYLHHEPMSFPESVHLRVKIDSERNHSVRRDRRRL
jgi:hypothetical protein